MSLDYGLGTMTIATFHSIKISPIVSFIMHIRISVN